MFRFLIAALLLVPSAAVADSLSYHNARFGTSASMPMDMHALDGPQNGDGYHFQRPGYDGTISIYGSNNPWDAGFDGYRNGLTKSFQDITYKAGKKDWFVLSGFEEGRIFYVRVKGCDKGPMHHIHFEFPKEEKSVWQPIIESYAKTLDGPCG